MSSIKLPDEPKGVSGPADRLAQGALELGVVLTGDQLEQFEVYYRELAAWNQKLNLTSVIDYTEVQVKHFLDSLTIIPALGGLMPPGAKVVDVGAGAGFPGLPLKLVCPRISLTLVESTGKKANFLRRIVEVLELEEVTTHWGRAEELARQPNLRGAFDLTLARGLARLPTLLEYTLPFVGLGGQVVAWKRRGPGWELELASASRALRTLGGRMRRVYPVTAAGLTDNRVVLTIEKVGDTPSAYPRRPGTPAKQPL